MVLFKKATKPGEHEVVNEGNNKVMHVNYFNYPIIPSIESDPLIMAKTIDVLAQIQNITRIVFHQRQKYEYSPLQTKMLSEIAQIYNMFLKQKKILVQAALGYYGDHEYFNQRLQSLQYIILNLLKTDPIGAYVETKRILRDEKINIEHTEQEYEQHAKAYLDFLTELFNLLGNTLLIKRIESELEGYSINDRSLYQKILSPLSSPNFLYTRLFTNPPIEGEEIDAYELDTNTNIQIFNIKETIKPLYHLIVPEFQLTEEKYGLIELARKVLSEHKPKTEEFIEPEKMRENFFNIGRDLIIELASHKNLNLDFQEINELTNILVRITVGFGFIETLLLDENIQDISVNSPAGSTPIFIVHGIYSECVTNLIPSPEDVESWASKFRLISARPLDEANPILDTELILPHARARIAIITKPLNPTGIAFSIRRHRDRPWTLCLFIKNKMLTPLAAGLLSFIIDGARSIIVAGTRGSGKTSLLGSVLVEISRKTRIISVEDTLELPTEQLRQLGYNIQQMKVRSALAKSGSEIPAEEGIRTSLRLGDSSLIVGEIRSTEALALYEAMRVGALANVVAGTIHGDSPYGVFDRVVNDLKVPKTSFKATDLIVIANPIRSADGLSSKRRIVQITEIRKEWEEDPLREQGFVDLMKYDAKTDMLQPTDELINGDTFILKAIGAQIREWAGNWDAIWENIELRAKIKETMVNYSINTNIPDLIEAYSVIFMNDELHRISEKIKNKTGELNSKRIFFEWEESLKRHIKENYKPY